ncbi:heterokaryon incompatibility protein-domain-containing protein [Coniochaeta sp. 2T2.1]|nr:heterokaryon incompatibility protein-domain-containing protein [Coniochaeta sp. 2T2.1]
METPDFFADEKSVALKRRLVGDNYQPGHLCIHCSDFVVRPVPREPDGHFKSYDDGNLFFQLATTRTQIRELAKTTGCPWWSMFADAIRRQEFETKLFDAKDEIKWEGWSSEHYEALAVVALPEVEQEEYRKLRERKDVLWGFVMDHQRKYESDDSVIVSMTYSSLNDLGTRPVEVEVRLSLPQSEEIRQGGTYNASFFALALPDETDLYCSQVLNMPVNTSPGSSKSLTLVRYWFERCATAHDCGILDLPPSLPSMLLAVGERDIRPVETTNSAKVRYAALSYCWGTQPQNIVRCKSTIRQLTNGIPLESLGATIRDTAKAVQAVGLEYLWIDSLCIVQDDLEAKGREITRMHDIYCNATVTIIASRAAAVQDGFLSERGPAGQGKARSIFEVKYTARDSTAPDRTVMLVPSGLDKLEPCNCGSKELFDKTTAIIRQPDASTGYRRSDLLWNWDQLVSAFSNRKLSYHGDRLPAISAIAREFAKVLDSEYVCGLWKSRLHVELLWKGDGTKEVSAEHVKTRPSWSWASYQGGVFLNHDNLPEDDDLAILGSEIIPQTPGDMFGAIHSASLAVRGLLTPVPTSLLNDELKASLPDAADEQHPDEEDRQDGLTEAIRTSQIRTDDPALLTKPLVYDQPVFNSAKLYLLVVGYDKQSTKVPTAPAGLVLSEEGPGLYRRAGCFEVQNIWHRKKFERWFGRDMPKPSREEYRKRLRYLWGGEDSIREIIV